MAHRVYVKSGNSGSAFVLWPAIALPAAAALSAAYAYALVYIPLGGYVNFLLLAGFVLGVGGASSAALKVAKCRNDAVATLLGVVGGLFALAASWVFFLYALINKDGQIHVDLADLSAEPTGCWELIRSINEQGWYTIGGFTPSGAVLWVLWAIEAIAVVFCAAVLSRAATRTAVFCETCGVWAPVAETKRLRTPPEGAAAATFAQSDVERLLTLPDAEESANTFVRRETLRCAGCRGTAAYRFALVEGKIGKKGELEFETTEHDTLVVAEGAPPAAPAPAAPV